MRKFSLFMALAMAFIATVLVPTTSEAKYRKRALPAACEGATEPVLWDGRSINTVPGNDDTTEKLQFVVMAAMDPDTAGETPVARSKWNMLCDEQRVLYKAWLLAVVRTALYGVLDYRFTGPQLFGGESYPDANGDAETLEPMDEETLGALLTTSLSELTVMDLVAGDRPGTPHARSLRAFKQSVCRFGGKGCKARGSQPVAAKAQAAVTPKTADKGNAAAPPPPVPPVECPPGSPQPCPPPAPDSGGATPSGGADSGEVP